MRAETPANPKEPHLIPSNLPPASNGRRPSAKAPAMKLIRLLFLTLFAAATALSPPSPCRGGGAPPRSGAPGEVRNVTPVTLAPNGALRVRGRPFFPLGVYHISALDMLKRETPAFDWTTERMMRALAERGYNTVHTMAVPDRAFLDLAAKNGLMVMPELSSFIRDHARRWDELARLVRRLKDEPQLLCWDLVDEPDPSMLDDTLQAYRIIAAADPDHPIHVDLHNPAWFHTFEPAYDILALDPYPLREKDPRPISQVTDWLDDARRATPKPAWLIAQCFAAQGEWRPPTPAELRQIVYQGLIGGAKGLWYYALTSGEPYSMPSGLKHWFLPDSSLWQTTADLNREIRGFALYLLEGRPDPSLSVVGLSSEKISPLSAATWRRGSQTLFLAVNNGSRSVTLQFRWKGRSIETDRRGRPLPALIPAGGTLAVEL
jgi:hypothetical protein